MSAAQRKRQNQVKTARLEIVARLYKRGYSVRQIRQEVMTRLTLPSYSLGTVHKDISTLLEEWRDNRLGDMNDALQLELERIDETCRELWAQWEKSKEDYNKTTNTRKGARRATRKRVRIPSRHTASRNARQISSDWGTRSTSPRSASNLQNGANYSACTPPQRPRLRARTAHR